MMTWQIVIEALIALSICVAYFFEPHFIRLEERLGKKMKHAVRTLLRKSAKVRQWALKTEIEADYAVDEKVFRVGVCRKK